MFSCSQNQVRISKQISNVEIIEAKSYPVRGKQTEGCCEKHQPELREIWRTSSFALSAIPSVLLITFQNQIIKI